MERDRLPHLLGWEPSYPKGLNGTFELAINVGEKEKVDEFFERVVEAGVAPMPVERIFHWKNLTTGGTAHWYSRALLENGANEVFY